jgi:glycosyltransferase involved in cell wall biosynthesis
VELRIWSYVWFASAEEIADYFRLADVLVMRGTVEGLGVFLLEAMASGIHVIGGNTDVSVDAVGDDVLGAAIDAENCD